MSEPSTGNPKIIGYCDWCGGALYEGMTHPLAADALPDDLAAKVKASIAALHALLPKGVACTALRDAIVLMLEGAGRELAAARAERDLAVAHDRQPYPTAEAYEKACAALERHRAEADALAAALRDALTALEAAEASPRTVANVLNARAVLARHAREGT